MEKAKYLEPRFEVNMTNMDVITLSLKDFDTDDSDNVHQWEDLI